MDATTAGGEKALPLPAAGHGNFAPSPSPRAARQAPCSDGSAAAVVTPAAAGAESGGGDGERDDDEQQVERFYALLDNIRAFRGSYSAAGGSTGTDGGARDKRTRCADPPWRPAFRLEDFESFKDAHADDTGRAETTKRSKDASSPLPEKPQADSNDCAAEAQARRAVASPAPGPAVQLRRSKKRKFERLI